MSESVENIEVTENVENNKTPKKYDHKKYYKTFYNKNQAKIKERKVCPVCYGSYTYYNKYIHNKSKRHMLALALQESTADSQV